MSEQRAETIALHAGQSPDPTTNARAVPIYQTVAYEFDDTQHAADLFALKVPGNIYTRIMNPTWDVFEQRVAALEGGIAACATASGQAAVTYSILNVCRAGDNIISVSTLYGGTYNLFAHTLPQFGIEVRFADPDDPDAVARPDATTRRARVFAETIGNPKLNIVDLRGLVRRRARRGPAADRRQHGRDAHPLPRLRPRRRRRRALGDQVHRRPRHLDRRRRRRLGHASTGPRTPSAIPGLTKPDPSYHGVVWSDALGPAAYIGRVRTVLLRNTGAALSPFNAFLFLQGLETLPLRMERHSANALAVAKHLEGALRRRVGQLPGPRELGLPRARQGSSSRAASAASSRSASRAAARRAERSSTASSSSATSRTSATPSRSPCTTPRRRTRSSTTRSSRPPA